jgi:O-antigen ligase
LKETASIFKSCKGWIASVLDFGGGDFQLCQRLALAGVFFLPISIGGLQLFLVLAGICWIFITVNRKKTVLLPPFYPFLFSFFIFSLLSLVFSLNPAEGFSVFKMFPLLLIPLMFYNIIEDEPQKKKLISVLYAGAAVNATWGLLMYASGKQHRLSGFLGHYMTAAGILMMIIIFLLGHLFTTGIKKFGWTRTLVLLLLCSAFLATLTRNAWVGAALGFIILFGVIRPRYVPLGVVLLFLFFIFVPPVVKERIASTFDIHDATIQDRLMMIRTGARIIKDNPLFGVGPEMVPRVYEEYKADEGDTRRPHLHNNVVQIAAEKGLLTAFIWLAFMGSILYYAGRIYNRLRKEGNSHIPEDHLMISVVVVVLSFFTAGLFEYNWGDTEVAAAFLFLVTIPFSTYKKQFSRQIRL